jgi:hypothetical protein
MMKLLSIVTERTAKISNECRKMIDAGTLFISNYLGRIV